MEPNASEPPKSAKMFRINDYLVKDKQKGTIFLSHSSERSSKSAEFAGNIMEMKGLQ